ncbi:MAG: DNA repair protein, partial [Lactobacillus sp.]|nr:DNA repair protein [Lactobacillus sp.]
IDAGLNYASSQRFPKMLVQAQHFFSLLTAGRYQQIKLGKKISVTRSDGKIRPVQYLSRATGEQLYFALKLAFVQQISDQINLPILIDDAFVNFDPERQSLIRQLLTSLSQTNQVIIFTAQPGLAKMLTDQPIMLQKEG